LRSGFCNSFVIHAKKAAKRSARLAIIVSRCGLNPSENVVHHGLHSRCHKAFILIVIKLANKTLLRVRQVIKDIEIKESVRSRQVVMRIFDWRYR